jgi:hypothetical protein
MSFKRRIERLEAQHRLRICADCGTGLTCPRCTAPVLTDEERVQRIQALFARVQARRDGHPPGPPEQTL